MYWREPFSVAACSATRHQEFIRFLNAVEAAVPAGKLVHVIPDNYGTHKHPKVRAWLTRHPRFTFHFTPTSASWLNAVEGFFAKLTRRRLKRGVFHSVVDLQAAINRFVQETNANPKPFVWTADPNRVLAAVKRGKHVIESLHSHVRRFKMQAQILGACVQAFCNRLPMGMAGGVIIETTVDQTLMRGSEPHDL